MSGDTLRTLAAEALKKAHAAGATDAEALVIESRVTTLTADGQYVQPHESRGESVGLRVLVDGRIGISGASSFRGIDAAVDHAVKNARVAAGEHGLLLGEPTKVPASLVDPVLAEGDPDRMSAVVERLTERLHAAPAATFARTVLRDTHRRVALANSRGLDITHTTAGERLELEVRVTRGTTDRTAVESWFGPHAAESATDLDALADGAIAEATSALEATPLAETVDTVILGSAPLAQLLGIASSAFNGVGVGAGKSVLADKLDQAVMSEHVTLTDEPHAPMGRARRVVDDEGTPTRRTVLVEDGVLKSHAHNLETARRADVPPTGHGIRGNVRSGVDARPLNIHLAPGGAAMDDLIAQAGRAVLITQPLMGSFVASRVTGDFSLVAPFGHLVEGGRTRHALPPTTVGGNVHRLLRLVRAVGDAPAPRAAAVAPAALAGGVSCAT